MYSLVIWVTGLSGAGKSTFCEEVVRQLKPGLPQLILLDGDVIREACGVGLGYSEADRVVQIQRLQRLAKALANQDMIVLVAALFCRDNLLAWNRTHLKNYFEIYIDTPLSVVMERDSKGLYAKAQRGEEENVVGLDIPWTPPHTPDLLLEGSGQQTPRQWVSDFLRAVPGLAPTGQGAA